MIGAFITWFFVGLLAPIVAVRVGRSLFSWLASVV